MSDRDIERELLEGLGRVVINWSAAEAYLAEFLSFLLKADSGAMYVLNQTVASSTQLSWIRTLAKDRFSDPELLGRLDDLFERIDAAREDRNAYVHGVWGTDSEPETALVQTVRLNRTAIVELELVTRADLDDLADRLAEIVGELDSLGERLGFAQPP
jgi:hypothetical protein